MDKKTAKALSTLFCFLVGAICGFIAFVLTYRLVDLFHLNYVWTSTISGFLLLVLLNIWDNSTKETRLIDVTRIFVFIFFVLSFFYGHEKKVSYDMLQGEDNSSRSEVCSSGVVETLIMTTAEDYPASSKCYHTGEQVRVVVLDNPVRMVLGDRLSVGEHIITMNSDGRLYFHIEKNAPAKVEIY